MRAARPTIRRFLKIVGRASLTRRLPRHPLPEGEGTHDKQVSVFEDRPEPHPAWVSGELIAVFRTLVVYDRPYTSLSLLYVVLRVPTDPVSRRR